MTPEFLVFSVPLGTCLLFVAVALCQSLIQQFQGRIVPIVISFCIGWTWGSLIAIIVFGCHSK